MPIINVRDVSLKIFVARFIFASRQSIQSVPIAASMRLPALNFGRGHAFRYPN